jgi:drug/metabolite transporter (DMT)-like permease
MTNAPRAPSASAVLLALLAVYLIWGSTYLAIRLTIEGGYPPLLMAGIRFVLAGAAMYAVLRGRGVPAPTRVQWRHLAVLGLLLMGLGNGLVTIAEQWVSSGLAAVAVASMPLWMALFAALRGQRPARAEAIGLGIGFVGVVWLNAGSQLTASVPGLVALLIAPMAWAFGSVWSRGRDLPPPAMSAAGQMLAGGAMMVLAGLVTGEQFTRVPTPGATVAVVYLMLFGSIVAFSAYLWLLHHVRPALASSYAYVNPPVAVLLGVLFAGETVTTHDIGAMAVILAGVAAITFGRSRAPARAAATRETA